MTDPREALNKVRTQVEGVVVGQSSATWGLMTALLVRGHVILEGPPGVAKTLLAKTMSRSLDLSFRRVQFTPDLMPSDVTGGLVFEPNAAEFHFRPGPVFTNLFLADELNRTAPKTQAALLEAMEERQVSVEGTPRPLPDPFMVIATQNPIEYEGTYPLPEAQLDRFLFKLTLGYPSPQDERAVLAMHDEGKDPHDLDALGVVPVASAADLEAASAAAVAVTVRPELFTYLIELANATRQSPSLALGVSPRGVAQLLSAIKAWAFLAGRDFATPDDVKTLVKPTWRHRVLVRPELELEGTTTDGVLDGILGRVTVPT